MSAHPCAEVKGSDGHQGDQCHYKLREKQRAKNERTWVSGDNNGEREEKYTCLRW